MSRLSAMSLPEAALLISLSILTRHVTLQSTNEMHRTRILEGQSMAWQQNIHMKIKGR